MAKAYVKIYINEKCTRTYGGNRSEIANHIAELKGADSTKLKSMYSQLNKGDYLRFGVIHKRNRNRVFRFHELIDDLSERDVLYLLENNILNESVVNVELCKSPLELKFDERGILTTKIDDLDDIFNGFIRPAVFDKFPKLEIVIELLRVYGEFINSVEGIELIKKRREEREECDKV